MKLLTLIALLGFCLPSVSLASQEIEPALTRESFSRGIELTPNDALPVQTLLLPESVYGGLSSSSLDDLRVFNADGEQVPYALRSFRDIQLSEPEFMWLPLYAIPAGEGELQDDMSLLVRRSDAGRLLEVTTRSSSPGISTGDNTGDSKGGVAGVAAYIVDLGSLERPAVALELRLPESPPSFLASFTVEVSADLSRWQRLVDRSTLASLDHNGTRLERTHTQLPATDKSYLRLRWLDGGPPFLLEGARLELQGEAGSAIRHSVFLGGTRRADEADVYDFPSAGPLPVDRVQLALPTANTLIQATLRTAPRSQGPWRPLLAGRFFRISEQDSDLVPAQAELRNEPYQIRTHAAAFWSLTVDSQGGGIGSGSPQLELQYFPHQLAFVTRGSGPYTLAFGRHGVQAGGFDWKAVTDMWSEERLEELPEHSVSMGTVFELAGPSVLVAPIQDNRLRKLLLWAVLLAGVLILGSVSWKVARSNPKP